MAGWALLLTLLAAPDLQAQAPQPAFVRGRVRDEGGVPVPGVLVRALGRESGVVRGAGETDELGFYRLNGLPAGPYRLEAMRLGYRGETREVLLHAGEERTENWTLTLEAVELEGIRVEAERSRTRVKFEEEAGATTHDLARNEIKAIPGLIEADPLRAVEVLPGVVTTSDFSSAYNVRGGSADQNLILLDGVPVFNPTHLGGFFSVFNGDMIQRAELRSGGFPPRYGGRVSSVLDIRSDPGDGRWRVDGGVSLLATRVAVGGSLSDGLERRLGLGTTRWRFSARRSYFDQLLKPAFDFPYHLTDLQGVFEGWSPGGDRLSFSFYSGRDVLDLTRLDPEDFPLRIDWDWGNDLAGARWTRPRPDGGWWEVRTGYSRFTSGLSFPDFDDTDISSGVDQVSVEGEVEARPAPSVATAAGIGVRRLAYDNRVISGGTEFAAGKGKGWEVSAFAQAEWKPSVDWLVEGGLRLDGWRPAGAPDRYTLSPRFSAKRFFAGSQWAVKASLGRYTQYLHSIRDEELPIGLDVWILAGPRAPHVVSDQIQAGFEGFPAEGWFASAEVYYRDFDGVVTTNMADDPNDPLDDYLPGSGRSYGADLFLQKTTGGTRGWLSVSLLRATRSFPDFLSGLDPPPVVRYPPVFDRRLDVDLVLRRALGRGLEAGLRWNFGSGLPYTRPLGSYQYLNPRIVPGGGLDWGTGVDEDGGDAELYGVVLSARNAARYPARHRLDLSLRWTLERGWGRMIPYLSVLNVYNRKNVLFYFYEYDHDPPVRTGISMFPFLPTVGVEVSFR